VCASVQLAYKDPYTLRVFTPLCSWLVNMGCVNVPLTGWLGRAIQIPKLLVANAGISESLVFFTSDLRVMTIVLVFEIVFTYLLVY